MSKGIKKCQKHSLGVNWSFIGVLVSLGCLRDALKKNYMDRETVPTPLTPLPLRVSEYWRERAAFQRSAFGQSTAGNDVVATIFIRLFFFFSSFFPPIFPPLRPFLIEGVLGSKNLFS